MHLLLFAAIGLLLGACESGTSAPAAAQHTYGTNVDATDAIPAVAVAAEAEVYDGRSFAVDGRITAVRDEGCTLQLAIEDGPPLLVTAPRTEADECTWQVSNVDGDIAAAAGSLHAADDTLRLTANGVEVTPVRLPESDS